MARSLAHIIYKGIVESAPARSKVFGSIYPSAVGFSTTLSDDLDTHDDFKPANKVDNSAGLSLKNIVEQDVKENPVMIYMKGVPDLPRCGFSALAVRVLKEYGVPVSSRNILEDPELKNAVKSFSHWPTFPQIFINGEFIGGSDIILNMHQTGELKEKQREMLLLKMSKNRKLNQRDKRKLMIDDISIIMFQYLTNWGYVF